MKNFNNKGFNLIEVLITIGVIAILSVVASLYLINFKKAQEFDSDVKATITLLRDAHSRSLTQDQRQSWGIYFINDFSPNNSDYFFVFKAATFPPDPALIPPNDIFSRRNLKSSVEFDGTWGNGVVYFNKISGTPQTGGNCLTSIKIKKKGANCTTNPSDCATIAINDHGAISY